MIKSPFDAIITKKIESQLNHKEYNKSELLSSKLQYQREKIDLESEAKLEELQEPIALAFKLIQTDAKHLLPKENYESLLNNFNEAFTLLQTLDFNTEMTQNHQDLLKISNESIEALCKMATIKFEEQRWEDCFAVCTLLCMLSPECSNYWYRFGIVAQKLEKYELAIQAYQNASLLNFELIGSKLFTIECYHKLKLNKEALSLLNDVKNLKLEKDWGKLVAQLESIIQ